MQNDGRRHRETLTLDDFRRAAPGERRQDLRLPCERRILILTCVGGEMDWSFRNVELFDCSPKGLGLLTGAPMPAGDQFLVKLKLDDKTRMLVYTVRRCIGAPEQPGRFQVGAELTDVVGDDFDGTAVRDALLAASSGAAADATTAPRKVMGPRACN